MPLELTGREPLVLAGAAVLGLAAGSFLNVCIWRLPRKLSIVSPGSMCPSCERRLQWWELIPVISYVFLGGRCRTCRAVISPTYPLVEAGTALLFAGSLWTWGWSLRALAVAVFGALLIVSGLVDLRHRIIPDVVTLPGIAAGLVFSALDPGVGLLGAALGVALGGGFLLAVAVVTNGGMGGGDIKLAAMMGAFLGWAGLLVALLSGFVAGAACGGALMLAGRKGRRDFIAFGPFLATGALAAAFWGPVIIEWYLRVIWG